MYPRILRSIREWSNDPAPAPSPTEANQDWGLGEKWTSRSGRFINQNGQFNVQRQGRYWWQLHIYQSLLMMSWFRFFLVVLVFCMIINAVFAGLILLNGITSLSIGTTGNWKLDFLNAFFFSVQTFTTVGYGTISPIGLGANVIASFSALIGLMSFALVTGLSFAKFSQPNANISFSKNAIICPYKDHNAFMFRLVNHQKSNLLDLSVKVLMTWIELKNGVENRQYAKLDMEREKVYMLPLNWTLVHVIDEKSPLYHKTLEDLKQNDTEFLVVLKGYDDNSAYQVYARSSYTYDEIKIGYRFTTMYYTNEKGVTILELDKLDVMETV